MIFSVINLLINVSSIDYKNNKIIKYIETKYTNFLNSKDYSSEKSLTLQFYEKDVDETFEELSKTQILTEINKKKNNSN